MKTYVYKNLHGGWSICAPHCFDIGNYASALHAIEAAARDCQHVKMLDFDESRNLAGQYRDAAEKAFRTGFEQLGIRYHGWALFMDLISGRLAPKKEVTRMQREAAATAAANSLSRVTAAHKPSFVPSVS